MWARPPRLCTSQKKTEGSGERALKVRVKDKRKSQSSKQWLQRQLNDPYVQRAKREGFLARAPLSS